MIDNKLKINRLTEITADKLEQLTVEVNELTAASMAFKETAVAAKTPHSRDYYMKKLAKNNMRLKRKLLEKEQTAAVAEMILNSYSDEDTE